MTPFEAELIPHRLHGLLLRLGLVQERVRTDFGVYVDTYKGKHQDRDMVFLVILSGQQHGIVRYAEDKGKQRVQDRQADYVLNEDDLNHFLQDTTLGNILFQYKLQLFHDVLRA